MMFNRREVLTALGACGLMPVAAKSIIARQLGRLPAPDEVPLLDVPARIVTPEEYMAGLADPESLGGLAHVTLRLPDGTIQFQGIATGYEITMHNDGIGRQLLGDCPSATGMASATVTLTIETSGPVRIV